MSYLNNFDAADLHETDLEGGEIISTADIEDILVHLETNDADLNALAHDYGLH